ncbi:MAG: NAD(P)H-dependent oxidoreductase [bacterium]|nr:NAD(P)H-dependent oxidoreductase [bacterium]
MESKTSTPGTLRILAVCGSLRKKSVNAAVLRAAARLASSATLRIDSALDIEVVLATSLAELPHFNEDDDFPDAAPRTGEARESHPAVARFRGELTLADAVLIASPEYAHGYPGLLKNALDWLVGSGQLVDKPVALSVASPAHLGGFRAQATLLQILQAMNARVVATANFAGIRAKLDRAGEVSDESTLSELRRILEALAAAVQQKRESGDERIDSQSA